jgi:uncharacterized protein YutE (UPF0331/DUF86 family)
MACGSVARYTDGVNKCFLERDCKMMPPGTIWLTPDILNWDWVNSGVSILNEEERKKEYSIWEHAGELISSNHSKHFRVDSIISMKRCVQHRIDLLNSTYKFSRIPGNKRSDSVIDLLDKYGIIKPVMIRKIAELRNAIEHKYDDPPEVERCKELLDFTWYFLKSTDSLIRIKKDGFEIYYPDDEKYWLGLEFENDSIWEIQIHGWLQSKWISMTEKSGWIQVDADKFETGKEFYERRKVVKPKKKSNKFFIAPAKRKFADISISGKLLGPSLPIEAVYNRYFSFG